MYIVYDMPPIDRFAGGFPEFWMRTMFFGPVSPNPQVHGLAFMFVRLVEAALVEYALGRQTLMQYYSTNNAIAIGAISRSISHFETCLTNAHRARQVFIRLRKHPDNGALRAALNEPRPQFVRAVFGDRLRGIRNEIHHTEESLMGGELGIGDPLMLQADGPEVDHPSEVGQTNKTIDRLRVGTREITFVQLAEALHEMGEACGRIGNVPPIRAGELPGPPTSE